MSLHGCFSTSPLVFMPKRPVADDQNARNEPHVKESQKNHSVYWNALVFFSARVLSHCGFILSLLAIWLAWLIPPAILEQPPAPDIKALKSRTNKPSRQPTSLPSDVQTNLIPVVLPTYATDNRTKRHVYFADAPLEATIGNRPIWVTESPAQAPIILQTSTPSQPAEPSLQLPVTENAAGPSESLDSLVLESDSSSRPSSLRRPGLNKFKLFRSYSLDVNPTSVNVNEEIVSPLGIATLFLKSQRASLPASKPAKPPPSRFPFRRCSDPKEQDPGPKPVRRTMPYGPPYFATPPMLLDRHHPTSLSTQPQFKDEIIKPESETEHSRGRTIRRVDLGLNVDKRHKPRSLSEDFVSH